MLIEFVIFCYFVKLIFFNIFLLIIMLCNRFLSKWILNMDVENEFFLKIEFKSNLSFFDWNYSYWIIDLVFDYE